MARPSNKGKRESGARVGLHMQKPPESTTLNNPYTAPEDRVMWAILTSVRDGVVGVEHARIYARAALAEMETAPRGK